MNIVETGKLLEPWNAARFSPKYWPAFAHAGHFGDRLVITQPSGVELAVAILPAFKHLRRDVLHICTIAKYRKSYAIVNRMAKALAPTVLQTNVIPVIEPVDVNAIESAGEGAHFIKWLTKRGTLLYVRESQ